ncbi:DNA-formamidopyrimidine glycosylase family protein [Micromonospora sp. C28SCA-DRY-2]|uniref:DNA-formamidopyrimidine glycosylase family protein n=1 Tax=Micromonospora sp. C28SCA-DRY-2 TaxID=3059522 RepID=UPI0026750D3B|nr:DNA glycosylase [Micromonospora sp. C28SCA-DRY-2]MDO3702988.1 DNA-formamidopyrimidine glycosylase family protein [Micromonospora sp. C28SCA-DRY-2]
MPEGHLIHRYAREQQAALAGQVLAVSSPQGRFDPGPYDGRRLRAVEAYGKHLLYHLDGSPTLHVHLGMRGLFLRHDDPTAAPRAGVRLRLAGAAVAYDLIAPIRCEPLPPGGERALRASLGPDPLRADADPAEAVRRLAAVRGAVGAAVLDQAVWAGIGNAWRAELLFLAGLDPDTRGVGPEPARRLWDLAVRYLALGRDAGQVVSDPAAPDERWVYKRPACRRCGAPVRVWELGGRSAYACPVDQPSG